MKDPLAILRATNCENLPVEKGELTNCTRQIDLSRYAMVYMISRVRNLTALVQADQACKSQFPHLRSIIEGNAESALQTLLLHHGNVITDDQNAVLALVDTPVEIQSSVSPLVALQHLRESVDGAVQAIVLLDPQYAWRSTYHSQEFVDLGPQHQQQLIEQLDQYGVPRMHYSDQTLRPILFHLLNLQQD